MKGYPLLLLAVSLCGCDRPAGPQIVIAQEPSVEAVLLYLACYRGGHEWVALEHHRPSDELAGVLAAAQPAVLVCSSARMGGLSNAAPPGGG